MRLTEMFEAKDDDHDNHADHSQALRTTGFWGAQGAGCIFFAQDTRRFLLSHRSAHVEQPNSWGSWGGAIDKGEDPLEAVHREVQEETGYAGPTDVKPMYVFVKGTFRYSNFLVIVPSEFSPRLDWENQGYKWCEFGKWPQPLHFGLVALFNDPASVKLMQGLAKPAKKKKNASGIVEAQFRQPHIMYHGTSSSFLRTILKQGMVPEPTKRRWAADDQQSQTSFSRVSLKGSYWTSNLMTASSSATNTMKKFGGEEIIVVAQIAEQSAYADEDNINSPLMWAMSDTVKATHPQVRSDFWIAIANDVFGEKRAATQAIFAKFLHEHLKGAERHVVNRQLSNDVLDTLILRSMAFEQKNGMRLESWVTNVPEDLPSIAELEARLLGLREQITKSYRSSALHADQFSHTLRMPVVVGFKGANRIRWILRFNKWRWETPDGGDKKLVIDPAILIYGDPNLPEDLLSQYRQRIGKFPGLVDTSGNVLIPSERETQAGNG